MTVNDELEAAVLDHYGNGLAGAVQIMAAWIPGGRRDRSSLRHVLASPSPATTQGDFKVACLG